MVPLWSVGTTDNEDKANMVWGKYIVQSVTGVDFVGSPLPAISEATKKRRSKKETPDEAVEHYVNVPVLINSTNIAPQEELLVYKAREAKRPRETEAITVSKVAKLATKEASSRGAAASGSKP